MDSSIKNPGRYFEDFEIGQLYIHSIRKTITESDNNLFCLLTMNHHPVHSDITYAEQSQHGKILVVGTYVISLAVGMSVPDISEKAIANLGYTDITHVKPVFLGDTIHAETKIIDKYPSIKKYDRGYITILTKAYNQIEELVLELIRKILIPRRPLM